MSKILKTLVATAALAAATIASATPIVGTMQFKADLVLVSNGNIDWNDGVTLNPPPNPTKTYGVFQAGGVGPSAGSFSAVNNTNASIQDMSSPAVWPGDANNVPIGVAMNIANFITFSTKANWKFNATYLVAGDIIGGVQTPYLFTVTSNGLTATIQLNGYAWDDANNNGIQDAGEDVTKWKAIISSQYPQYATVGAAIADLTTTGALANNAWSGTLLAERLPEPASLALVGLALAGLGVATRRRQAK